jgi:hypothetical protein
MLGKTMAMIIAVSQITSPLGQMLYGLAFRVFSTTAYIPVLMCAGFTFITACVGKKYFSVDKVIDV